jgi:GNAT superfamily N-acetyltransferase
MSAPFSLRTAVPDDAATILDFIQGLADYEREPDAVEVTAEVLHAQMSSDDPPFECLLAEEDGTARGFALFFRTYSTWKGLPGMWLEDLFVPPEHRGRGIGIALFRACAALAVDRGYGRMEWSVLDWNQPAIGFYVNQGSEAMDGWTTHRLSGDALHKVGTA